MADRLCRIFDECELISIVAACYHFHGALGTIRLPLKRLEPHLYAVTSLSQRSHRAVSHDSSPATSSSKRSTCVDLDRTQPPPFLFCDLSSLQPPLHKPNITPQHQTNLHSPRKRSRLNTAQTLLHHIFDLRLYRTPCRTAIPPAVQPHRNAFSYSLRGVSISDHVASCHCIQC